MEDCRVYQNQLQYLIRWTECESLTWEPAKLWMVNKRSRSSIDDIHRSQDHWTIILEDLEPKGGILSQRRKVRRYPGLKIGILERRLKELCYGKAETSRHLAEAAEWLRNNLYDNEVV
jgi:hypothetical protein